MAARGEIQDYMVSRERLCTFSEEEIVDLEPSPFWET